MGQLRVIGVAGAADHVTFNGHLGAFGAAEIESSGIVDYVTAHPHTPHGGV
jgi:hypothetical protein